MLGFSLRNGGWTEIATEIAGIGEFNIKPFNPGHGFFKRGMKDDIIRIRIHKGLLENQIEFDKSEFL